MLARSKKTAPAAIAALMAAGLGLAGCSSPQTTGPAQTGYSSEAPTAGSPSGSGSSEDLAGKDFTVSWKDALQTAQDAFSGDPTEISLDWETSEFAYTIKLVSQTEEYEAEISAESGDVVSDRTETLEDDDVAEAQAEVFDPSSAIDVADAISAATGEVDGAVTEWSLDRSSQGLVYEVNIVPTGGGDDLEVKVDAASGEVLSTDR